MLFWLFGKGENMTNIVTADGPQIFDALYSVIVDFCAPVVVVIGVYFGIKVFVQAFRSALGK